MASAKVCVRFARPHPKKVLVLLAYTVQTLDPSPVARLAIHRAFPAYATEGYRALLDAPPVIYLSAAYHHHDKLALTLLVCRCAQPC